MAPPVRGAIKTMIYALLLKSVRQAYGKWGRTNGAGSKPTSRSSSVQRRGDRTYAQRVDEPIPSIDEIAARAAVRRSAMAPRKAGQSTPKHGSMQLPQARRVIRAKARPLRPTTYAIDPDPDLYVPRAVDPEWMGSRPQAYGAVDP
jgi:hypothetical protein